MLKVIDEEEEKLLKGNKEDNNRKIERGEIRIKM